jgi:FkbM family methyltransferase
MRLAIRSGRWWRVKRAMEALGLLEGAARFPFHGSELAAPLREPEVWVYGALENYNRATIANFAGIADRALGEFDYLDCGAHLGLFGAQFATFSQGCRRITAVEPNGAMLPFLEGNLRAGRVADVTVVNAAVAGFTGRGRLVAPDYDPGSDHAHYIAPDPDGPIEVVRLDAVGGRAGPRVAVKLDVEGQELAVLEAAADWLRARERVVLCVELHRRVLARVGQTDAGLLAAINAVRPMRWVDADRPERVIDLSRPVLRAAMQCDVIGVDAG